MNNEKYPVLEVKGLSISFDQYDSAFTKKDLSTVKNINITVGEGELVAIVGASGSGKSLLAHAILGILPYNASYKGDMKYMSEELTPERQKELRGSEIVLVPQSVSYLDPLMKTGKQLALGKGAKRAGDKMTTKEKISGLFKRYNLPESASELYPFELSGGMARRVLISSAVMENPKLVIADEPTPGLNIEVARQVISHFREMADDGAGVLLITHDLELAIECADRIVVFREGETIAEVRPADFEKVSTGKDVFMHPYTKELYKSMPKNWEEK